LERANEYAPFGSDVRPQSQLVVQLETFLGRVSTLRATTDSRKNSARSLPSFVHRKANEEYAFEISAVVTVYLRYVTLRYVSAAKSKETFTPTKRVRSRLSLSTKFFLKKKLMSHATLSTVYLSRVFDFYDN
jgi:hypothetical protein